MATTACSIPTISRGNAMTTTPDLSALCAELLDELDYQTDWSIAEDLKDRARAALATPPPEPPTDA
jgi:hypothetical protein